MMGEFDRFGLLNVAIPTVLAVVGVLILGKGIWLIVRARRFLRVAEQVPGLVSAHRHRVRRTSDGDRITTVPVLRFRTRTGQLVEAEQSISLRRQVPDPDSEADVLYDPADVRRAALTGSTSGVTFESVGMIVLGIILTIAASNIFDSWLFRVL